YGREFAPKGEEWDKAMAYWETLYTDHDAEFDKVLSFRAEDIEPMITYGTNPGMGIGITQRIPESSSFEKQEQKSYIKALAYMGLQDGSSMIGHPVDYVFIGSCTNSRIEDLRQVAQFVAGKKKDDHVVAGNVAGFMQVELQGRAVGLPRRCEDAGFALRAPGCSACQGMN